jgi:DnaK suppressor protein
MTKVLTFVIDAQNPGVHHETLTPNKAPSMSAHLNPAFKQQLLAQRASLLAQLSSLRGGAVGRAEASAEHFGRAEELDSGQVSTAREIELALDDRETIEIGLIDAALARIAAGNYGLCTDCGVEIPLARLHAAPEAPRCIPCQEKLE